MEEDRAKRLAKGVNHAGPAKKAKREKDKDKDKKRKRE